VQDYIRGSVSAADNTTVPPTTADVCSLVGGGSATSEAVTCPDTDHTGNYSCLVIACELDTGMGVTL
jgi:hypothetical protein